MTNKNTDKAKGRAKEAARRADRRQTPRERGACRPSQRLRKERGPTRFAASSLGATWYSGTRVRANRPARTSGRGTCSWVDATTT